ncbi:MAG: Efflux ABC transporter, permease/ATP-binding protein [uncultured Gemmatimonadaceae bacterium]|uniref:Efflux ABC transporter, permease/ATP-binding protein n=1 Tax=uncultured Gemmatimonadaceae bacterium TaxID=246130 RepID=A0A6J4MGN6_9BACT|nr:MAG: Efflux ABC transporter, permease/ATP-binding protein [uncultured Gemmatimonadaceae bacterium]
MPPRSTLRPGGRPLTDVPPSLRERVEALRYVPPLIRLVWETHRGYTAAIVALRVARAFVPLAALWVAKLIIDFVQASLGAAPDWRRLAGLVLLELAIAIGGEVLARASVLVESLLGDLFSNRISVRLMRHAATVDLAQFEDPEFYDHLERARRQTVGRIGLLTQLLGMGQNSLTLLTLGTALLAYNPWLVLLLVVATVPAFVGETHFASLGYSLLYRWTPQRRQLDYLRFVGASDRTAKEVQMFGLAGWLTERYRVLSDRFYEENRRLSVRRAAASAALSVFGALGYYAAYAIILVRAVEGAITIGTLTFLAASFSRSRDLIQGLLLGAGDIYEQSLYLKDLFAFFEVQPTITSRPGAPPVPRPVRAGFVFEDVGFRYPGSERWAVRHVNLAVEPGERVALVGENGAGKTTITKLLARLYDPTEGRILLDGRDLREYDLASVRQAIGVIFQDFVRYDMAFDENIAVGEIGEAREYLDALADGSTAAPSAAELLPSAGSRLPRPATGMSAMRQQEAGSRDDIAVPAAITAAAEQSLAASLLPRLPDGYRQMLGRRFEGGVDLSGGEWQKVALARAYMREAALLILDEPTAALDARAEYDVFVRFNELMAGRMAVVISHRFSTVRMADRIIVLDGGAVAEEGTHDELLTRDGIYAELFQMQAAGYR